MRILVVGAGAVGGYFGGRLLEKGEDVTFLVRENRQKQLKENGLVIDSVHGNISFSPKMITSNEKVNPFDVIILSTKAYHLESAIEDISPFAGEHTIILPLLNGISHIEVLIQKFGEERVLGGLCFIETTLDSNGKVIQTSSSHDLVFGERSGEETSRIQELKRTFSNTKANFKYSDKIMQEMWNKYLFISVMSGATTLMRTPIGPIRETEEGEKMLRRIINEVVTIMQKIGAPISEEMKETQLEKINAIGYEMKSSMQRDMEKGMPVEADHFFQYLLKYTKKYGIEAPALELIYSNLKVYETYLIQQNHR
ncbi:2-dehydropantoate 2-reductase [Bacillus dakarensis]|uniref:2-dehydropantoate 2-reductase n=1 Tax=Robertmurraya dakarensis TaxID=1926278 RepID=UPI000981B785|nr:2-dehydropantoate 2-reductase [Bacillus dakarensis]